VLKKAVKSDYPRTLTTVLSLCHLNKDTLNQALEWAVETGSAVRLNHLLEAGASIAHSKALGKNQKKRKEKEKNDGFLFRIGD
jgi:hypothetical protein